MKRHIPIVFLFSLLALPAGASFFRNYQVEDGLSHNSVWTVMQDNKGFLWFGTIDGLNRFDGKSFKVYKKQQGDTLSIGSSFIHCLKEDSRERFLVGTKQGLYLFNRETETFTHVNLDGRPRNEDDTSINYIMEDPDGNIWLGCYGRGIYVLNADLQVKKQYLVNEEGNGLTSNYIWCMVQDYNGVIWIGTDGEGLLRFDPNEEKFTSIAADATIGITDGTIYSLHCDIDNNIWVGTSANGLYRYNYRTGKANNYLNAVHRKVFNVKAITEYSDHELIMGSDAGLVRFDRNTEMATFLNEEPVFDNITDKSIFAITRDAEGGFWVGTYFGGVNYYSPFINRFSYYATTNPHSTAKSIISCFVEDEWGKLWIGTKNEGLIRFNPRTSRFEDIQQRIQYHDIQALMLDKDELWVSMYGKGVSILNIRTNQLVQMHGHNIVNAIFKTSKGVIMLATPEGVNYIDPQDGTMKKHAYLDGVPVKAITEDYNGSVWFAAHMHGLIRLSADGTWDAFTHNPNDSLSLPGNNVNCVYQDARYRLWVGTEGEGLALFNTRNNCFEYILNEKSGLPSNIINSIMEDTDGNIWVSTGGGLVKVDPGTKKIHTFRYIEDLVKLRYNLNCGWRASDNRLYFGGTNGFIAFNPKEITGNAYKPAVMITGFQLFGREVVPGVESSPLTTSIGDTREIVLEHHQSTFSFDFVSLSYLSPDQNSYSYQLKGFDTEWHQADNTNNKAIYMNIPPGNYEFIVRGANNDGVWSDNPATIRIEIKRPFLLSVYMIVLYVVVGLSLFVLIITRYNRRLKVKNQEQIYKYKAAKEKEIYETKISFFTNIAHEIRTPLSLIVAPLENIIHSGDGTVQTKGNLEIIERNANRLLELVNQLLDFRKIEEDMFRLTFRRQNITSLVKNISKRYRQLAESNCIDLQLLLPGEDIYCVADTEAIKKMVSNLISNALKYAKSRITVKLEIAGDNLLIMVEDDGIGIKKAFVDKIFEPFFQIENEDAAVRTGSGLGLALSQSLAMKHGGSIAVSSEYLKGSVFTISLPMTLTGVQVQEEVNEERVMEEVNTPQTIQSTDKLKVVLAEDNKELRVFISNSLSEHLTILEAANGAEALELVEKEAVDIIISDIIMPEMDGLELCDKLKSNPAYSHIPLILLSAKTDTSTKVEGLNKGADVYMEKPFSMEQLKAQINSIIDNRNRMRDNFIQSPLQYFKQQQPAEKNENTAFVEKLNDIILENLADEGFSIDNLSEKFLMSRSNFHKKIKSIIGMTPNDYIKLIRLNQSAQLLATGKYKINEVCYLVGFNTPSYFSKCFFEQFGKLPKEFIEDS